MITVPMMAAAPRRTALLLVIELLDIVVVMKG